MNGHNVCTTSKAADVLGVSVSLVQQLVENGSIAAWKTRGGHRRISLAAISAYQKSLAQGFRSILPNSQMDIVVIVGSGEGKRAFYEENVLSVDRRAGLRCSDTGSDALLCIARQRPDVVLADIETDTLHLVDIIHFLLNLPELTPDNIAIVSSLSEESIDRQGAMSAGVVLFCKPVNPDELRGYLLACRAKKARALRCGVIEAVAA